MTNSGYLLAYFLDEHEQDGEAVRFAISVDHTPYEWTPLFGGEPQLHSQVGEKGARDPFLVRLDSGETVLIATDLRAWPDHDWARAVRHGSRGLLVARSRDLVEWSDFELVEVSPPEAGNTWAPKAFFLPAEQEWLVLWASALFEPGADRTAGEYQRVLAARTTDFRSFSPPEVYLDRGRDVIDVTFLRHEDRCYRFSVDQRVPGGSPDFGRHPFEEVGSDILATDFVGLTDDVGKGSMVRGEGVAVAEALSGDRWYLLIDEFGLRGYQLFETSDLASGDWTHRPDARLPAGARHGSMMPITEAQRARLLGINTSR